MTLPISQGGQVNHQL